MRTKKHDSIQSSVPNRSEGVRCSAANSLTSDWTGFAVPAGNISWRPRGKATAVWCCVRGTYLAPMTKPTRKPNILFIMTDQQRYDAVGVNGIQTIRTPNLDALARSGVNLHRYYVNAPVCVPSRTSLFTGRYLHAHRVRENHTFIEADREIHLFRALKHAGYALGYIGKNHLLENEEFDNFEYADVWGHTHEPTPEEKAVDDFGKSRGKPMLERGAWAGATFHDLPPEHTRPFVKASSAIRFLEQRPTDKPFCLCLSFSDPHAPHIALRKYESVYPLESMPLHPTREGELARKATRFMVKWRASQADKATDEDRRRFMAVYFAMISWVDEQIGRVLESLREHDLEDNTIVVFTTDHGEFCFDHGMVKKDLVLLDSLLHVPFFISWPRTLRARDEREAIIEEVDVLPTLLELAGVKPPLGVQGVSFAPLLRGEHAGHKDAVYAEICPPWLYNPFDTYEEFASDWQAKHDGPHPFNVIGDFNKSVRERDYRYTWYGSGEEELYDHRVDPHEWHNLAADPAYADTRLRLKLRLLEWNALSEDPLDPITIRQMQQEYGQWRGGRVSPGKLHGPEWLKCRETPNPRRL
ncbi:MAG: sulfatase-like hydrolase/transferase [Chitinivibrionales bacterium]|nr:sulfatase-like hydrolase/transferase [Chitinivibrionales bacterium]